MTPDHSLRIQPTRTNAPSSDTLSPPPPPPTVPSPSPILAAGGPHTGFVYDGKLGELYGIFLPNLLWTILTLTVFRFWAKTRMRRYLWSRTSLNGDRFEYTGTGGEMFLGFLIVMPVYVLFFLGLQAVHYGFDINPAALFVVQIVAGFLVFYLTFVAQYAAQRYRLTRTLWRGIRGGMTGSAWSWGSKGMLFAFLSGLTLSLAWPWTQMQLLSDRINNSYFGDAKAQADLKSGPVYVTYFVAILCVVGGLVIMTMAFGALFAAIYKWFEFDFSDPIALQQSTEFMIVSTVSVVIGYLCFALLVVVAFSFYQVAVAREVAAKLHLGGLRFATPVTAGRIMGRYVGNILIIVFTLGFGLPIAIHRTMLFLAANIEVVGEIEGSDITHANLPRPKAGEGLLEAFDPGIL
ncbi:YjgN family protein [Dongia sp.]|uniref:YjgN family protein n=1 Tax=Dongia sp. TaxID=1977262 RepID=UPI0035AE6E21